MTAGKLAKLYHTGNVPDAVYKDNVIYCGSTAVYTVSDGENGESYREALNKGIRKNRGEPVQSDFAIDKRREKLQENQKE